MMIASVKWWFLFVALIAVSTSYAAEKEADIEILISASGVEEMVNEFPKMVKLGLVDAFKEEPNTNQDDVNTMLSAMDRSIVPEKMLTEIQQSLNAALTKEQVADLVAWYQSPLGKALADAELKSGTDEAFEAMSREAPELMKREQLIAQVTKIENQLDLTTMTVDFFEKVQLSVFSGMMSALQPETVIDLADMKKELASVRKSAESNVQQMMIVSMAYAYKDFTPEEIDKYSAFLATSAAETFNHVATQSMFNSIQQGFHKWAEGMSWALDDV